MKTETMIDPRNPPAVHEWTGPTGVHFRDVRSPAGTYYRDATPAAVVAALDSAMQTGARVRFWCGNRETGKSWHEENDVCGTVGASTGWKRTALLIRNSRSTGGGAILAECIVRLDVAGRTVYRHPGFKLPEIRVYHEGKHAGIEWAADIADDSPAHINPHARFKSKASADRWAAFMRGERAAR